MPKTGAHTSIDASPDRRWDTFAAREPYFAVLNSPAFLRERLSADAKSEFFKSGETLVDAISKVIEQRLTPDFAPTSILEYGCGVGRLALPLARRAARRGGQAWAVDRSRPMLDVARQEAIDAGIGNLTFLDAEAFVSCEQRFDFITAYLVLQRMPPSRGLELVRELANRLVPGGIGVFHVPYRTSATSALRASRWLRRQVPGINALVNLSKGLPLQDPFLGGHPYDVADIIHVLQDRSIGMLHVELEQHAELDMALLFVERPLFDPKPTANTAPTVDVKTVIEHSSMEALNRAAEEYFSTIADSEHHFAKPFSQPHETPSLLMDLAVLLQGLDIAPGTTVLDFGAGSGWLARCLTQLGCRVILLDVSPAALDMARELYLKIPIIGERPRPEFVVFDGHRIDLPDGSVDRIVSFHAFHHVPHPEPVLAELARILRPGGVAGFVEPGPRHSRSPFSQFEMRTYRVVENDVDVHQLERAALACGFREMKLAVFHGPPFQTSLHGFEEFLAGGPLTERWVASTRLFLRNVRTFFLKKEGSEALDSRRTEGLACQIHAKAPERVRVGEAAGVEALVTNSGEATWLPAGQYGGLRVGVHLRDGEGNLLTFAAHLQDLTSPPRGIGPGETIQCRLEIPAQPEGVYIIELDCVAERVSWFAPLGSTPATLRLQWAGSNS